MADFGRQSRMLADDPCLRWLGPHKGIVHLALASSRTPALICGPRAGAFRYGSSCWI